MTGAAGWGRDRCCSWRTRRPRQQQHHGVLMHTTSTPLATIATVLAGIAALTGLAVPGVYVDAPNWVQQARGTDLATLFLAVPVLAAGLWRASRGSAAGRLA